MRKLFRRFIQDMKMRNKLLVTFALVAVVPIVLVSVLLVQQYSASILEQTYSLNETNIEQMKTNITNYYESYARIADTILSDNTLLEYLNRTYPAETSYEEKYYDFWDVSSVYNNKYTLMNTSNMQIKIYTTNPHILVDNNILYTARPEDKERSWFRRAVQARGGMVIQAGREPDSLTGKYRFSISQALNYGMAGDVDWQTVLVLSVSEDSLFALLREESDKKQIYLLDSEDRIITSNFRNYIGKPLDQVFAYTGEVFEGGQSEGVSEIKKTGDIVFWNTYDLKRGSDFGRMLVVVPTDYLYQQMRNINTNAILISVFVLAIAFLFLLFFSKQLTMRLLQLVDIMSHMDMEKLNAAKVEFDGTDEIGRLSRNFEKMLRRLRRLIDERYAMTMRMQETELHQRKAELNALQSQINPHFLYNIMESVSISLWEKGDTRNADMLQKYARLLRRSAEWGDDNVTVAQELELVENYLSIQKYRFEERFEYRIAVRPKDLELVVPKFTLMPLVENAFEHGLDNMATGGLVEVFSRDVADGVELVVRDNGAGIPPEKLEEITQQFARSEYRKNDRIGIYNVHRRLALLGGEAYNMYIQSTEGHGTEVMIRILLTDKQEPERFMGKEEE